MFAGIVSLDGSGIKDQNILEVKEFFSAENSLKIIQEKKSNYYFIRGYTEALTDYSGVISTEKDGFSLLAGEPLLSASGIEKDHFLLRDALQSGDYGELAAVRGVFCAVRYENYLEPVLDLCADKLGIRPIYYWSDGNTVAFSTALKVLEGISIIPKEVDQSALSEIVAFGIPLANRTKYKFIKVMREAEIVRFSHNKTSSTHYYRWDHIKQRNLPMSEAIKNTYEIFRDTIRLRLKDDSRVHAFLSGGMDSRAIVATLIDLGVDVETFNCSPEKAQDKIFAKQYADAAGCSFHVMPHPVKSASHMAKSVMTLSEKKKLIVSRPKTIWSGDGGSVGLGCVYLDEQVVNLFRSSECLTAIQYFKKKNSINLPLGVIKKEKKSTFSKFLDKTIGEELLRIECDDKGQKILLFLMFNDQRRHMYNIYENVDFHGTEYQLPFFDFKLLEYFLSLPLDYRLNHKIYHEIFKNFPAPVFEMPWQTYPGHVPCPLPIDMNLDYQWGKSRMPFFGKIIKQMSEGVEGYKLCLFMKNFGPLSRLKFFIAVSMHFLCLRNYDYIIKAGNLYGSSD